jgi:hypothetical protein
MISLSIESKNEIQHHPDERNQTMHESSEAHCSDGDPPNQQFGVRYNGEVPDGEINVAIKWTSESQSNDEL